MGTGESRRIDAPPKMKKFGRYPFLPSMLCGVGGPATQWLRPKQYAISHPEWFDNIETKEKGVITALDLMLGQGKKRREELERTMEGHRLAARASDLAASICRGEYMNVFSLLNADVANCPSSDAGRCAAHHCVEENNKELLRMVILARADVNIKDNLGHTPLMLAARLADKELTKILLDAGADATEEDVLGRSAGDMVKVEPVEVESSLKVWREKITYEPVKEDHSKMAQEVKTMIEEKDRPKRHGNLLINAIKEKDMRTAESSIQAGGDVNLTDEQGDTPLVLAARGKWKTQEGLQMRLIAKVLKAGADVNFQNALGNTALHFASHRGKKEVAELLLQSDADPALRNAEGNTALMYAAHGGYEEICTALLEDFASPYATNEHGLTAKVMAERKGFKSCAILIQAYEMAPKKSGDEYLKPKIKPKKEEPKLSFDYSKWNRLQKEMETDERVEEKIRKDEAHKLAQKPMPTLEEMGPEAFGLPADTPWPPPDRSKLLKGPFDYSRWDKIVYDIEKIDQAMEQIEHYEQNPTFEMQDGMKVRRLF